MLVMNCALVQDVAFVELQVIVEPAPKAIEVGDAEMVAVGAGTMVTVAVLFTEPLGPVQLSVYVVVESGFTVTEPDVAFPVEKLVPVHVDAFAEDHVSVEAPPEPTDVGEAERLAVGAGAAVTVTVAV